MIALLAWTVVVLNTSALLAGIIAYAYVEGGWACPSQD